MNLPHNATITVHRVNEYNHLEEPSRSRCLQCVVCSDVPTERVYRVHMPAPVQPNLSSEPVIIMACCQACALTWIYLQVPLQKQAFVPQLHLTIELVPSPCWYSNMRTNVPRSAWDKLPKQVYAAYHYRCGICQAEQIQLHCHEIWHYDDEQHIQKLAGFIALCEMCHHCKHIGLAGILASEGKLDFNRVVEHFKRVNQCSHADYDAHSQEAWDRWRERSQHQWTTDLGAYAQMVK